MIAVPAVPPVTTPAPLIEAVPGALLLHVPPAVASVNAVVRPEHTARVPVMAVGKAFTVTVVVA